MNRGNAATDIDLASFSVRELEALSQRVAQAIHDRRRTRAAELLAELSERAESEGLSFDDVVSQAGRPRHRKRVVRFRNPTNESETWSGRGPRPVWLKQAIDNGTPLESLRVNFTGEPYQCTKEGV